MIPMARERVYVTGRNGTYFVLSVDTENGIATLVNLDGEAYAENVRFNRIVPMPKDGMADGPRSAA